ncbi:MAG: hypothetical protein II245_00675, partial [Bacteroidaceae bacterium]|nr:hypothetical protein [Bacteroidaceae bacterium]
VTGWSSASTPNITTSNEIFESEYPTEIRSLPSIHVDKTSFDLQGRRIDKPQEGVNIIRNADGKTKKVLMKR